VAKIIAAPDYKTKVNSAGFDERAELQYVLDSNRKQSSRFYTWFLVLAAIAYLATLVVYAVVLLVREDSKVKFLGIVTPIFILFSDLVIYSLREKPVSVDGKSSTKELEITDVVYSLEFQSFVLLTVRVVLCFEKHYWLIVYSIAYIIVQIVGACDLSYAIFTTAKVMGNEQEDILGLYQEVPLLQAAVRSKSGELNCRFPRSRDPTKASALRFKTTLAMVVHFVIFIAINYISSRQPKYLTSQSITFVNSFGQWVIGVCAICVSIVLTLFIIWR
jgi:hypothetical protein